MSKMLIDRTVIEQVLKTLEEAEQCPVWPNTLKKAAKVPESADALRTALAQPVAVQPQGRTGLTWDGVIQGLHAVLNDESEDHLSAAWHRARLLDAIDLMAANPPAPTQPQMQRSPAAKMSVQPQIQRPLPPGTVIEYCGHRATVVEDKGGRTLTVDTCGLREEWEWVLDGDTCTVVSLPETSV